MKEDLIRKIKILKALNGVPYLYYAEAIGITRKSFYNWLRGDYELSQVKYDMLCDCVEELIKES